MKRVSRTTITVEDFDKDENLVRRETTIEEVTETEEVKPELPVGIRPFQPLTPYWGAPTVVSHVNDSGSTGRSSGVHHHVPVPMSVADSVALAYR